MSGERELDCREAFQRLDDYVDRELDTAEYVAVQGHLDVCANCAREFATEADLLAALKEKLRRIAAPPGLMARIAARLEEDS